LPNTSSQDKNGIVPWRDIEQNACYEEGFKVDDACHFFWVKIERLVEIGKVPQYFLAFHSIEYILILYNSQIE
jgi:hypothetical protein